MPLVLENFVPGDPGHTLNVHHARDAYNQLNRMLTAANVALMRVQNDANEQARFARWFGPAIPATVNVVRNKIRAIHRAATVLPITFRNGGAACQIGTYAYVRTHTGLAKIYLCDHFFQSGRAGIDSTVGTIIHELSHLFANTQDHAYGQVNCQNLAANRSAVARQNADNYQYYCEEF